MLDPVPRAGARRQVGHRDRQPGLVGEALQLALPQPDPYAVAAAAVGGDQQPCGGGVAWPAEVAPPVPEALDGEGGGVVIDAEIDPSGIRGDVVDAVGRPLAQLGEGEIVHPNRFGLALGAQLTAAVLEVSDELFLLIAAWLTHIPTDVPDGVSFRAYEGDTGRRHAKGQASR